MPVDKSIDQREVAHFDQAHAWWDEGGAFAGLHRLTLPRLAYIRQQVLRYGLAPVSSKPRKKPLLAGLRVVDIGCGGGLLCEPLARLGADVVGIDLSKTAIATAQAHAEASGLAGYIKYAAISSRQLAASKLGEGGFDIVIASEVIEHVADRRAFLADMAALGGGSRSGRGRAGDDGSKKFSPSIAIFTTINRNLASIVLAKYAAEYILRLAPKGSHQAGKFVRPADLRREARAAGIAIDDVTGIRPSVLHGFVLGGPPIINYAAAGLIISEPHRQSV